MVHFVTTIPAQSDAFWTEARAYAALSGVRRSYFDLAKVLGGPASSVRVVSNVAATPFDAATGNLTDRGLFIKHSNSRKWVAFAEDVLPGVGVLFTDENIQAVMLVPDAFPVTVRVTASRVQRDLQSQVESKI